MEEGRVESIVVGTDGSDTAGDAAKEAVRLATVLGGELHIVSAFEPFGSVPNTVSHRATCNVLDRLD